MVIVPTKALPNQSLQIQLGNQSCQINIYQLDYGLFMDLYVNDNLVIGGVICLNLNLIVRSLYLGFIGDFVFGDTQGVQDPDYTGLGTRYQLAYLEQVDIAALNLPIGES